ncbi:SOS response-associated peptidase [Olleya aquimaris]|uniref:Abasic site processing protein n=1 Tax=Olleya aquimaris TaxID=639310 RepID=A0A327RJH4_9FLAO|nr:SOS response-associated peptidase [Olleya aquimaris]RAJ16378.1 putative SOS response-associated peptidase YedK [Olleya aquimaris]
MCFHTSVKDRVIKIEKRFGVTISDTNIVTLFDQPNYHLNGFAHPNMLVIPQGKPEVLAPGVWGIVPDDNTPETIKPYYKEAVRFGGGLNAQSEKLFSHFVYKNVALTQRCIIPVSGFFEPHTVGKKKFPFYIHRQDDQLMGLAGIYTVIGTYITYSILTKKASPLFAEIHNVKNRQPVILEPSLEQDWLNPELSTTEVMELIAEPFPDSTLETYPVSKELFSPKVDSNTADSIKPVQYPELNTLF